MFDAGPEARPTSSRRSASDFAGAIPNNYRLVREAIDRGVPLDEVKAGNNITSAAQEADRCRRRRKAAAAASRGLVEEAQRCALAKSSELDGTRCMAGRFTAATQRRAASRRRRRAARRRAERRCRGRSPRAEAAEDRAPAEPSNPLLTRQAARRQGPPAPPADRGDQSLGAGKAARGRDAAAHPAARHAIHRWSSGWRSTPRSSTSSSPKSSTR